MLIDTSVWIEVFRDGSGQKRKDLLELLDGQEVVLSRFTQLELLQGSRDEKEWELLSSYLEDQDYLDVSREGWVAAARIYFDLRRAGLTVRSPIDCCIAQLAISENLLLVHRDRDFETIARIRPLRQIRMAW